MKNEILKEAKRQYIIDCTMKLIETRGIDHINMEDIAKAASYTKRTLYAYFNSKDEIFLWVYTDDLSKRWAYQKEHLESDSSGIEKLRKWACTLFDYCNANNLSLQVQNYMDYYFVDHKKVDKAIFEKFEHINNELADSLRSIFEEASQRDEIRNNTDIDMAISQFLYSYRAILQRAFSRQYSFTGIDKEVYVKYFIDSYMNGLTLK